MYRMNKAFLRNEISHVVLIRDCEQNFDHMWYIDTGLRLYVSECVQLNRHPEQRHFHQSSDFFFDKSFITLITKIRPFTIMYVHVSLQMIIIIRTFMTYKTFIRLYTSDVCLNVLSICIFTCKLYRCKICQILSHNLHFCDILSSLDNSILDFCCSPCVILAVFCVFLVNEILH